MQVDMRRLGDVTLLTCKGRIVAGEEAQVLRRHVTDLMASDRQFVLHLGEVTFVDSSGLGLLVRLAGVTRAAHGDIKLCGVRRDLAHTLHITNLKSVLETHESEVEAVGAFYERARHQAGSAPSGTKVLCVDDSEDVLALLRELLRHAGYAPITTGNIFDARVLAKATMPALVVTGPSVTDEQAQSIRAAIGHTPVIALDSAFGSLEASDASARVVAAVKEKLTKN